MEEYVLSVKQHRELFKFLVQLLVCFSLALWTTSVYPVGNRPWSSKTVTGWWNTIVSDTLPGATIVLGRRTGSSPCEGRGGEDGWLAAPGVVVCPDDQPHTVGVYDAMYLDKPGAAAIGADAVAVETDASRKFRRAALDWFADVLPPHLQKERFETIAMEKHLAEEEEEKLAGK